MANDISVSFEMLCSGCGEPLKGEFLGAWNQLSVSPCKACVNNTIKHIKAEIGENLDLIEASIESILGCKKKIDDNLKEIMIM